MGIDFTVIFLIAFFINLAIALVVGVIALSLGIYLYRKLSSRARNARALRKHPPPQTCDTDKGTEEPMQVAA